MQQNARSDIKKRSRDRETCSVWHNEFSLLLLIIALEYLDDLNTLLYEDNSVTNELIG